jgi:O-antigen/teichoic acid export membrane protein
MENSEISDIYILYTKILSLVIFFISFFLNLFSTEILFYWIGKDFSDSSSVVLSILCISLFFNCMSTVPSRVFLGLRKQKLLGCLALSIAMPYTITLFYLVSTMGIIGAAYADLLRASIEFSALTWFNIRTLGRESSTYKNLLQPLQIIVLYSFFLVLALFCRDFPWPIKLIGFIASMVLLVYLNISRWLSLEIRQFRINLNASKS